MGKWIALMALLSALALPSWAGALSPGDVCAWIGAPRTGKSQSLQRADREGAFPRRVVFDPYAARDRLNAAREGGRGHRYPWPGLLVEVSDLLQRPHLLWRERSLVVSCPNLHPEAIGEDFTSLGRLAWDVGDLDLLCEEAGLYSRFAIPLCMQLASGGGHAGVRLVLISQSFTRLTADVRRHVSAVVAFPTGAAADYGELRDLCGPAYVDELRSLRKTPDERTRLAAVWRS